MNQSGPKKVRLFFFFFTLAFAKFYASQFNLTCIMSDDNCRVYNQ